MTESISVSMQSLSAEENLKRHSTGEAGLRCVAQKFYSGSLRITPRDSVSNLMASESFGVKRLISGRRSRD